MFFCVPVEAHQDRIIELKNGKLIGFPDKYHPAYFDLQKKSLQIGSNKFIFPQCVSRYFPENDKFELFITSSWYHDLKNIPPYMVIRIQPLKKEYTYELVFELDTLKIHHINIRVTESDTVTAIHELKIDDNCKEDIKNSYPQDSN